MTREERDNVHDYRGAGRRPGGDRGGGRNVFEFELVELSGHHGRGVRRLILVAFALQKVAASR